MSSRFGAVSEGFSQPASLGALGALSAAPRPVRADAASITLLGGVGEAENSVAEALSRAGFRVGRNHESVADLIVAVHAPPGWDAMPLCSEGGATRPPLIVVGVGTDEVDKILALELGADDFVAWPSPRELVTRSRALLRRWRRLDAAPPPEADSGSDAYVLVETTRDLHAPDGRVAQLAPGEVKILVALAGAPGGLSRSELCRHLYGDNDNDGEEGRTPGVGALSTTLSRLRRKTSAVLGEDLLRAVHGARVCLRRPLRVAAD